jgi:hypothetical protein
MALLVTDRFIFPDSNVSDADCEVIFNKDILTKTDILKFCHYYYQDIQLEYEYYDAIFKQITKQNDCELWEILNQNMRIEDDVPDYSSCLRYALKYASYEFFGHVLYYFCTINDQDDISYDDLKYLSTRNFDHRVHQFFNQLDYLLPQKQEFGSKFALKNKYLIFKIYDEILMLWM